MDWDDLRFLLAVLRARSHAGAARRLGVNESTVARRMAAAARRFGAVLVERGPEGLVATAAGAALLERAERIEREVAAGQEALGGGDVLAEGTVRVTAVPILANRLLAPALPRLVAAHPGLCVELVAEGRNLSLTKREADMALRLARPVAEQRALARRVGRLGYAVFRAPGGAPGWISYDDAAADLPQARWIAAQGGDVTARASDAETVLALVAAGAGRSLLPVAMVRGLPGLVQEGREVLSREVWLMTHPDMRGLARIGAVTEWIGEVVAGAGD